MCNHDPSTEATPNRNLGMRNCMSWWSSFVLVRLEHGQAVYMRERDYLCGQTCLQISKQYIKYAEYCINDDLSLYKAFKSSLGLGIDQQSISIQTFEFDFPAGKYILLQNREIQAKRAKHTEYIYYIGIAAHIPPPPPRYYKGRLSI